MRLPVLLLLCIYSISTQAQGFSWAWARPASSTQDEEILAVATDTINNAVYIGGRWKGNISSTYGPSFSATLGGADAFFAKYDQNGNLLWAIPGGSITGDDEITGLAVDNQGNLYVTGTFTGVTLTFNSALLSTLLSFSNLSNLTNRDIFLLKISPTGTLLWSKHFDNGGDCQDPKVAAIPGGIFISGNYQSSISIPGSSSLSSTGGWDGFVAKYSSTGTFQFSERVGASGNGFIRGISSDGSNAYITGHFEGATMGFYHPGGASSVVTLTNSNSGTSDAFYASINGSNGNNIWARHITGSGEERGYGISANGGSVYLTGYCSSGAIFDTVVPGLTFSGQDVFIARANTSAGKMTWVKVELDNSANLSSGRSISAHKNDLIVAGSFNSDINFSGTTHTSVGGDDYFVASYDTNSTYRWSKTGGATLNDRFNSVDISTNDEIYAGGFSGDNFMMDAIQVNGSSNPNILFAKLACTPPSLSLQASDSICLGDSSYLALSFTGAVHWFASISGVSGGASNTFQFANDTLKFLPNSNTTYSVISAEDRYGCSMDPASVTPTSTHVAQPIASNTITANQTICYGATPAILNGSTPTGGAGYFHYQWEYYNNGWINAPGLSTGINYNPPTLTDTTLFRRIANSSTCTSISDTVEIETTPLISGNTISPSQIICYGQTPAMLTGSTPAGGDGSYSYLWESSADSLIWSTAAGISNTPGYTPSSLTSTLWFRRKVSSGGCTGAQASVSNTIKVQVLSAISNNSISSAQTLCQGGAASSLTGSALSGGNGSYIILWESSIDSSIWLPAAGTNNQQGYTPALLTQTTWFRRTASSGPCSGSNKSVSTPIKITVLPSLSNNTLSTSQIICSNQSPATLTGTTPLGGTGSYLYLWEQSTNGLSWTTASGNSAASSYNPSSLTQTTYYRRIVSSGACSGLLSLISDTITISVLPPISANTISSAQTICAGSTGSPLTGSSPSGGNGTYTYLWEQSTDNLIWTSATGTNNFQSYVLPVLTDTTWYRRTVSSGACSASESSLSSSIKITVLPPITNNSISNPQSLCGTQLATPLNGTQPTGGNGIYTYQWQSSTDNVNFSLSPGPATLNSLTPGSLSATTWFRRVVSSGACTGSSASISDTIEVIVLPVISNNTIGSSQTLCFGQSSSSLSGSTPTGGDGTYSYHWESSTDSIIWVAASGNNGNINYTPGLINTTTWYRRLVSSGPCNGPTGNESVPVKITLLPALGSNSISISQTICSGQTPSTLTGTNPTGGNGIYNYLWESSSDNINWSSAAGVNNNSTYNAGSLTDTIYFRRKVSSGACSGLYGITSDTIAISVLPPITSNTISSSQTICSGTTPTSFSGSTPTGGNGIYNYTWESSADSLVWVPATGVNNQPGYSSGILTSTVWFRRIITSGTCAGSEASTSLPVKITIDPVPGNNTISASQQLCEGATPALLSGSTPTGGNGTFSYSWEESPDGLIWNAAAGTANQIDYQPGSLIQTTWYRRVVSSGACTGLSSDFSSPITITIEPAIDQNLIGSNQVVCNGSVPALLTGNIPTGGNGVYNYLWESSTDSINWNQAGGINNLQDHQPTLISAKTFYRRIVTSGTCTAAYGDTSQIIVIDLFSTISNNTISTTLTGVCEGSTGPIITGSTPTGGNGAHSFLWEVSADNIIFIPAIGINNLIDYTTGTINDTLYYRRKAVSLCLIDTSISNGIMIHPLPLPSINAIADDTLCAGDTLQLNLNLSGTFPLTLYMEVDGDTLSTPFNNPPFNWSFNLTNSATYHVLWLEDSNGCKFLSNDSFAVEVFPVPTADAGSDEIICGDQVELLPVSGGTWVIPNGISYFNNVATASEFIDYTTILRVSNGICSAEDEKVLSFYPVPAANAGADQILFSKYSTTLDATLPSDRNEGEWKLIEGDGEFTDPTDPMTTVSGLNQGVNRFMWTVSNVACDSAQDEMIIHVKSIFIPDGFSPNGDGINDLLLIEASEDATLDFAVFNRWGQIVFQDANYRNTWNGKNMEGKDLPNDTYFYQVSIGPERYEGFIIIRR